MPAARFVVADVTEVKLPTASFDAVVAVCALSTFRATSSVRSSCARPNGCAREGLLLANLGGGESFESVAENWHGVPMFFSGRTPVENRDLLVQAGFELLREELDEDVADESGASTFVWVLPRKRA